MIPRVLATAAALWGVGFLLVYVAVVRGQGSQPAQWFLALTVLAVLAWAVAAVRQAPRVWLLLGLVLGACCTLAGLLSIGLLLVPALAAAALALALGRRPSAEPGPPLRAAAGSGRR
ncbi:hypothetical protein [uncultured Friedmanniella sp.]|uniref:hypothetical protein n=1 Tax=uncultured Friedmanniella sp. TaxID=335381 RepID=UPI0035CA8C79